MVKKFFKAYGLELPLVDVPHLAIIKNRAPTSSDKQHGLGDPWIHEVTADTRTAYLFGGIDSSGNAIWVLTGPGASDVDTLTGDGGGAIGPTAGTIVLSGGTNITTAGTAGPGTITFNLDAAITLATSVTSPIYTAAAALAINAPAGQDITIKMGDNAGVQKVSFTDSDDAEVFSIDSNGAIPTLAGLTVSGAFTQTAGAVNIGQDNAANVVNIAGGTTARAVGIANSAAAHVITLGSVTGACSLDLLAGTGNFSLEGNIATTYAISNVGVNTGQVDIAGGTGARTINIGAGGTGAKTIGIGAAASADIITIGDATGAGSLDLACGTGNFTLEGNVASTYTISGTGVNTGLITIGGGTGAQSLDLMSGGGLKTLNIAGGFEASTVNVLTGNNTGAQVFNLGSGANAADFTVNVMSGVPTAGTQTLNLLNQTGQPGTLNIGNGAAMANTINIGGTGACVIGLGNTQTAGSIAVGAAMTSGTIDIGGSGAHVGIITIAGGTGAQAINIANSTGGKTVNLAAGAGANLLTIGSSNGASSLDLLAGTGNFTLEGNVATTYDISSTGANTGTCKFASGTGARIVEIGGGGTGIKTINIGAAATADVITVGDATGAGSLSLVAGTGNITMTGTVEDIQAKFVTRTGDDITFTQAPLTCTAANTGGVATGATGDTNLLAFQEGVIMEQFVLGAAQTIIKPVMDASGLLVSGDLTTTEGYEYSWGASRANSRHSFTIGTSAAFFLELQFKVADVSGCEPLYAGFRITQAEEAVGNIANYTDFVGYGLNDGVAPGDCVISTQLNTGGLVNTDTNDAWADAATHTLRINVSAAGVVTFLFDGGAPTATQIYSFDNADVVHPFIRHEFNAVAPGTIHWISSKVGFQ